MSGKNNEAKIDDSLGKNHSVVFCDVGHLTFELGFELVTPSSNAVKLLTWM